MPKFYESWLSESWLSGWWGGGTPVVEPASLRDARRLAQLHGESFHRGWGEGEFEGMLTERNTLVHRLRIGSRIAGFAVSRMAADEAEILSIAVAASHTNSAVASVEDPFVSDPPANRPTPTPPG